MANNHTNLQAVDHNGQKLSVQHTSTDSPILPAANIEHLKSIDPSLVGWVVSETEKEANARRTQESRINLFIFIESISGVAMGGLVSIIGFLIGGYLVLEGHDWAGVAICGTTLGTIVTVLMNKDKPDQPAPPIASRKRSARPKKVA